MGHPDPLVASIESFEQWSLPGTFLETVHASPQLDPDDRRRLDEVWSVACDADHWGSARELQAGIAAIECALTRRFAWLSPLACRHLARAASYQWR
ncbi:hypothetical protein XB05_15995 [Xanthomonas arboricola]|uniref:hypothetical protein n=1 Tax=Xanthomonas arboricola TaxID=56448 RepID=UPI00061A133F|nr:hypothetical protein [Xanthomonas arboricola]AKC80091.1 hypothetical protein XB05_15995 [Xanthomonas arboricola]